MEGTFTVWPWAILLAMTWAVALLFAVIAFWQRRTRAVIWSFGYIGASFLLVLFLVAAAQ